MKQSHNEHLFSCLSLLLMSRQPSLLLLSIFRKFFTWVRDLKIKKLKNLDVVFDGKTQLCLDYSGMRWCILRAYVPLSVEETT